MHVERVHRQNLGALAGTIATMTDNVHAMACNRLYPGNSDSRCTRQRGHAGEHIAPAPGGRATWDTCDETTAAYPGVKCDMDVFHPGDHIATDAGLRWSDDADVTILEDENPDQEDDAHMFEGTLLELPPVPSDVGKLMRSAAALLSALVVLLVFCMPALIIAAYRWAL